MALSSNLGHAQVMGGALRGKVARRKSFANGSGNRTFVKYVWPTQSSFALLSQAVVSRGQTTQVVLQAMELKTALEQNKKKIKTALLLDC